MNLFNTYRACCEPGQLNKGATTTSLLVALGLTILMDLEHVRLIIKLPCFKTSTDESMTSTDESTNG